MSSLPLQLPPTFTYAQARAAGMSKKALYRARDRGQVEAIARGVYQRRDAAEEAGDVALVELAVRAPLATLCLETALARHGLSDALVAIPDVPIPRGTRPPVTALRVRWHVFQPETFELGRGELTLDAGVSIGLYSPERTIIDSFRLRGREGHEVAYEALRRWLRQRGAHPSKLLTLAEKLPRASRPLQHALEVLG